MSLFVLIVFVVCFEVLNAVNGPVGADISLACDLSSVSSIWWQKFHYLENENFFLDLQQDHNKYAGLNRPVLTIKQLTYNDGGTYRCKGQNSNGQEVYGPQLVLTVTEYINGIVGQSTTLRCKTFGSYRYKWMLYFWHLIDPSKYQGYDSNTLTILNTQETDAGTYTCFVEVQGAYISSDLEIIVVIEPINGNWGSWSSWSSCSTSCGGQGTTSRTRLCNKPAPANGGAGCGSNNKEIQNCSVSCSVINGNWGSWTTWSSCSVTCGEQGTTSRSRLCNNPAPANGGEDCGTDNIEYQNCFINCPVNGNWGPWSGTCSVTCGDGIMSRLRLCNSPSPAYGGLDCVGLSTDTVACSLDQCIVNGNWGVWSGWNACTATCGLGERTRTRTCNNPPPSNGGSDCGTSNSETITCSTNPCPEQQQSSIVPAIVGSLLGVGVLAAIIVGVAVVLRRKTGKSKENAYKSRINIEKDHIYSITPRIYVNEEISMDRQVPQTPTVPTQSLADYLLIPYTSSDLAERFKNRSNHCLRLKTETKYLSQTDTGSGHYELEENCPSEDLRNGVMLFKDTNSVSFSMITRIPLPSDVEKFWKQTKAKGITKMFLLLDRKEKVSELFPSFEESLTYDRLTVELESTEKFGTNSVFTVVKVKQFDNQDQQFIKIYKTMTNERLQPQLACNIIDKMVETTADRLLFVFGKSTPVINISSLVVCLNAIRKIKMDEMFNLLLDAKSVKNAHHDWFNEKEDLQYCYDVMREYLESVHTYDVIL